VENPLSKHALIFGFSILCTQPRHLDLINRSCAALSDLGLLQRSGKGENCMELDEMRTIARQRGVEDAALKDLSKTELVRAIQTLEANEACFNTGQAASCGQSGCLWREDCL
jgi:hypothetical protein